MHVVIIGAGLVGITSAYALNKLGAKVTVIDRREGAGLETSFANAALMHPSLVDPWNSPGVGWDMLRWLGREDAPMLMHLAQLPSLSLWGLRFLAESRPARHQANTLKNLHLALLSRREMTALRGDTGISFHWKKTGVLSISRSAQAFAASQTAAGRLAPFGVNFQTLDRDETVAAEPALKPIAGVIAGSVHFVDDERGDPFLFAQGMTEVLSKHGVEFRFNTPVIEVVQESGSIRAVRTAGGDISGDAYVLAAGSFSVPLARPLGINVPVRPAKGYSATITCKGNPDAPKNPVSDNGVHAAVTPVDDERVRIAGTAEFAGYDATIRQPRIDYLMSVLGKIYPRLAANVHPDDCTFWAGLRPMSFDGVPTISRTKLSNLFLNTGHGHIGWTTAAGSARLVADMILDRKAELDLSNYSIDRF
ncbi:MAG: D-amino acid dehydrogenase [Micropepsaceae bacterium]